MDPLLSIQLALPAIKPLPGFEHHTALLRGAHSFQTRVVLGFLRPDAKKDKNLGELFSNIVPLNNRISIELAVVLPDLLPNLDGFSEGLVQVESGGGAARELCLSNRMARLRFVEHGEPHHCLTSRDTNESGPFWVQRPDGEAIAAVEEIVRTTAAMRFELEGESVERALEESIRKCVNQFLECINHVRTAVRATREGLWCISRTLGWDSVPIMYLLVSNTEVAGRAQLALTGARASLHPPTVVGNDLQRLRDIAAGRIVVTDVDRLLSEALSSALAGEHEFAFLQAVIAAEIETGRVLRSACERCGVTAKKLKEYRDEMTFGWMLNVGLSLVCARGDLPEPNLMAEINAARKRRNDMMHEGQFTLDRGYIHEILARVSTYVAALRSAAAKATSGHDGSGGPSL